MHIIKILFTLVFVLILSGCTTKTPFQVKQPVENAALVYIYVTNVQSGMDDAMEDSKYKTQINRKNVAGHIRAGEYKVFDMKPAMVLFTATRRNIEDLHIKLNLQAGQTYYLRTQSAGFGEEFSFEQVSASKASKELQTSKLAGSFEMDMAAYVPEFAGSTAGTEKANQIPAMSEAEIDAIIEKKLKAMGSTNSATTATVVTAPKASTTSKLDEIKQAYEMKKDGLLTNEEFKAMKAEILAK